MAAAQTTEPPRDQWSSKFGFIMAAAGSAIGLGNIWRYPYVAYDNGGGAFLIPYFVALATAGIPILILEYSLGHKARKGGPGAYAHLKKSWEPLGWWQAGLAFFISTFYVVIIAWALAYAYFSAGVQWGSSSEAESFFLGDFLGVSDDFWSFGGLNWKVLLPLLIVWAAIYYLLRRGVSRGIELASKILLPALVVMMLLIVLRGVTLPGATEGLNQLFTPDFAALKDPQVWTAAYGQVFFSLSVGFATMLTYASYLKRKTDINNTALVVGLSNAGFEFLAAIGVFSVIGFFAVQADVPVAEAANAGPGLAFVTIPAIISEMPAFASLFGILFFLALIFAGLTSLVSLIEPPLAAIREKFNLTRTAAVNWVCGVAALISLVYATYSGLMVLDTADHFLNTYGLVLGALAMIVLISWLGRQLGGLQDHINKYSYVRMGMWWKITLSLITPVLLGAMTFFSIQAEFAEPYEGYPVSGLIVVGVGVLALTAVLSFVLPFVRRELSEPLANVSSGDKS